jgi:hypothetical protein
MAFAEFWEFEETADQRSFNSLSGDRVYDLQLRLHDCYALEPPVRIPPSIGISTSICPDAPVVKNLAQ